MRPAPATIDGFKCFAPELAVGGNEGFPIETFEKLFAAESGSFWFKGRNNVVLHFLKKHLRNPSFSFLEVGCGTGFVLEGMSKIFPSAKLEGADLHLEGLKFARQRLPGIEFIQLDATRLPYEGELDAIGLFDVVEHVPDDAAVMAEAFKALKPGGFIILTVPQHPQLWSPFDVAASHLRRYTRGEMTGKLQAAGFSIVEATSFVFLLSPLIALDRLLSSFKRQSPDDAVKRQMKKLNPGPVLSFLLNLAMGFDMALISAGASLPFGGSLLVLARK